MIIKSLAMASAGLALVAAPVAASAAPANQASSLSVSKSVRAGSSATRKGELAGFIIVILAAVAVAGGVYLAVDGDDDADSN
jgi:ABC-type amino acid transport substrate-binding protein